MTFNASQPYNELPYLPPKATLESIQILKACIPARTALAELKQAGELLPNQGLLVNALPLLEAKDSSEIENIGVFPNYGGTSYAQQQSPGIQLHSLRRLPQCYFLLDFYDSVVYVIYQIALLHRLHQQQTYIDKKYLAIGPLPYTLSIHCLILLQD